MISPAFLQYGDKIGIVSPSGRVENGAVENAVKIFEEWGFSCVKGNSVYSKYNHFAGDDSERTADFQNMLDNPEIKAIICARGGYGAVRIIDRLDFSRFVRKPKWICGYSDITVLHSHLLARYNSQSIQSLMAAELKDIKQLPRRETSLELFRELLLGKIPDYKIPKHPLSREGYGKGIVTGGNISVLCSLAGSLSAVNTKGKILFLEEVGEYLYNIDRMMNALKRSGFLNGLGGLLVGGFNSVKDNTVPFGFTAEEIVLSAVKDYNYPVLFGFPSGHQPDNYPLIMGREAILNIDSSTGNLQYT